MGFGSRSTILCQKCLRSKSSRVSPTCWPTAITHSLLTFWCPPRTRQATSNQVLDRMLEDEYITLQQYQDALNTPLLSPTPNQYSCSSFRHVYQRPPRLILRRRTCHPRRSQVHTTLDLDIQNLAQSILNQELDQLKISMSTTEPYLSPTLLPAKS